MAAALVERAQRIASCDGRTSEDDAVDSLELEDLARRGYVHIGRRAASRVALRLYDQSTGWAARLAASGDAAAP